MVTGELEKKHWLSLFISIKAHTVVAKIHPFLTIFHFFSTFCLLFFFLMGPEHGALMNKKFNTRLIKNG